MSDDKNKEKGTGWAEQVAKTTLAAGVIGTVAGASSYHADSDIQQRLTPDEMRQAASNHLVKTAAVREKDGTPVPVEKWAEMHEKVYNELKEEQKKLEDKKAGEAVVVGTQTTAASLIPLTLAGGFRRREEEKTNTAQDSDKGRA